MWWPPDTSLIYGEFALDFYQAPESLWECLETRMTGPDGYWCLYLAEKCPTSVEFELLKRMHADRLEGGYGGKGIDTRGLWRLGQLAIWAGELDLAFRALNYQVLATRFKQHDDVERFLYLLLDLRRFDDAALFLSKTWRMRAPYLRREIKLGKPDNKYMINWFLSDRVYEVYRPASWESTGLWEPEAWSEVGRGLSARGYYDRAEAAFREALRRAPDRVGDRLALAELYRRQSSGCAMVQLSLVLEQEHDNVEALRLAARFLMERRAPDMAKPYLERIADCDPGTDAEARFITARALAVLGRRKESTRLLQKLVDDFPKNSTYLKYLASLYRLADEDGCVDCYRRLAALEPRNAKHREKLEEAGKHWPTAVHT